MISCKDAVPEEGSPAPRTWKQTSVSISNEIAALTRPSYDVSMSIIILLREDPDYTDHPYDCPKLQLHL